MIKQILLNNSRFLIIILLLFSTALGIRLTYQDEAIVRNQILSDAESYFLGGYNLYHFGIYSTNRALNPSTPPEPNAARMPGYSLFLAPFFAVTDNTADFLDTVLTVQAIIGSITVIITFLFAYLLMPLLPAFLVGLLTAFSPHLVAMEFYLLTESLYTFFLVLALYLLVLAWQKKSNTLALLSGCSFGALVLIKDSSLLLGIFLALIFFLSPTPLGKRFTFSKQTLIKSGLVFVGIIVICGPYFGRNFKVFGKFMPNDSRGFTIMTEGTYPDLVMNGNLQNYGYPYRDDPERSKMINDKGYFVKVMHDRIKEQPLNYLKWYLFGKILTGFQWDVVTGHRDVYVYPMARMGFHVNKLLYTIHTIMKNIHWLLLWAMAGGIVLFLRNWLKGTITLQQLYQVPILMVIFYSCLQLAVFIPIPRYTIPLRPFIFLLAVWALFFVKDTVIDCLKRKFQ